MCMVPSNAAPQPALKALGWSGLLNRLMVPKLIICPQMAPCQVAQALAWIEQIEAKTSPRTSLSNILAIRASQVSRTSKRRFREPQHWRPRTSWPTVLTLLSFQSSAVAATLVACSEF